MAKTNYKSAFEKLQQIYDDLKEGNIEIDDLDIKLKKALEYIKICKETIQKQEVKIKDILKEIEKAE
ncbi:MAG: exodeoxyribonuclease VII small subunit [Candidatus Margulisbacteria bacterium]|nr:exodeoxyribonuclease VII small subunit [Candidatus Margulisiibacteriota bacterium]